MSAASTSCIFCQIIDGSVESSEVYRDEECVAFLDLCPVNAGHALVCPARHVSSFTDLEPAEMAAVFRVAQKLARAQKARLPKCSGVNLLLSDGEAAGQEVAHVHCHVVPRWPGDGFGWRRSGTLANREELDLIAAQIRES